MHGPLLSRIALADLPFQAKWFSIMATRRVAANATAPTTTPSASRTATPARRSTRTRASTTTADRYYDPELARFLQPDSTVPDPEFSQAYNRYAYVYNNPLKFTDPTGQFAWAVAFAYMATATAEALPGIAITTMVSAAIACEAGANPTDAFLGSLTNSFCGFTFGAIPGAAIAAMITGDDPLQAAMCAGVAAAVQFCLGFSPQPSAPTSCPPSTSKNWLYRQVPAPSAAVSPQNSSAATSPTVPSPAPPVRHHLVLSNLVCCPTPTRVAAPRLRLLTRL
ncbi:MAG: hypothetical protein GXY19_15055 [Phycisphaerae bacterium]|nr:hypothetical protein [Phycisphaerae bacterium]